MLDINPGAPSTTPVAVALVALTPGTTIHIIQPEAVIIVSEQLQQTLEGGGQRLCGYNIIHVH